MNELENLIGRQAYLIYSLDNWQGLITIYESKPAGYILFIKVKPGQQYGVKVNKAFIYTSTGKIYSLTQSYWYE